MQQWICTGAKGYLVHLYEMALGILRRTCTMCTCLELHPLHSDLLSPLFLSVIACCDGFDSDGTQADTL